MQEVNSLYMIAKHFELNIVLWAFHTIQPYSYNFVSISDGFVSYMCKDNVSTTPKPMIRCISYKHQYLSSPGYNQGKKTAGLTSRAGTMTALTNTIIGLTCSRAVKIQHNFGFDRKKGLLTCLLFNCLFQALSLHFGFANGSLKAHHFRLVVSFHFGNLLVCSVYPHATCKL